MRVPKIIWKHNLLIHSSSSRAADPVQWSNFPQQQDALEKKFSTTWSTLFCCSLWKSPFTFYHIPSKSLNNSFGKYIRNHSLDETECVKKKYRCRFCMFVWFAVSFVLMWCRLSPLFHPLSRNARWEGGGGGAFMPRKKQGGKTGIRFSEIELGMRMVTMATRTMCICC